MHGYHRLSSSINFMNEQNEFRIVHLDYAALGRTDSASTSSALKKIGELWPENSSPVPTQAFLTAVTDYLNRPVLTGNSAESPRFYGLGRSFLFPQKDFAKEAQDFSQESYTVKNIVSDNESDVFSMDYSPDGNLLLAGCGDGQIKVYKADSGRHMYSWNTIGKGVLKMPVTSVTFRPAMEDKSSNKNMALVAGAGGTVQHWHITSGRLANSITEENNQAYAVSYREDGKYYATAGKDSRVRIYDERINSPVATLHGGNGLSTAGHANRIFAVKWTPFDPNCLITGGWDNTVQIWDKRREHAVRRIYGPHICGNSIDIDINGRVLTGSWRQENQVQLWDFKSGKLLDTIPLQENPATTAKCKVYTAQYCDPKRPGMITYGGSGANEAKVIDTNTHRVLGAITGLESPIFAGAVSKDSTKVSFAGTNGKIYSLAMSNAR